MSERDPATIWTPPEATGGTPGRGRLAGRRILVVGAGTQPCDDPDAGGWTEAEAALLRAVDDLHGDQFISDATWQRLGKHYDTRQVIDLVFAVGQYMMVSRALNSFGVQIES